jgi:hypothetical protein
MAGNCQEPVMVSLTGAPSKALHRLRGWANDDEVDFADGYGHLGAYSEPHYRHVDLAVRCRRCAACLRARSAHWKLRAVAEISAAERTWFGTLTLSPAAQFQMMAKAANDIAAQGLEFERLEPEDQFRERCKPLTRECQLWLKRLRKQSGRLRYAIVVERHKTGLPHVHCLIHEVEGQPIRHRVLAGAWHLGFVKFNLVAIDEKAKAAAYVAKYLAKSALTRVKASRRYGTASLDEAVVFVKRRTF